MVRLRNDVPGRQIAVSVVTPIVAASVHRAASTFSAFFSKIGTTIPKLEVGWADVRRSRPSAFGTHAAADEPREEAMP